MAYTFGEEYDVVFRVDRIIREYEDDYFKIAAVSMKTSTPLNSKNKLRLSESEIIYVSTPSLVEGNTYKAVVVTVDGGKYGMHLSVERGFDLVVPENENDYQRFIQQNFQGIGKVYAKKLTDLFGLEVIDNILHNERALKLIGVPEAKEEHIRETAFQMVALNRLIGFLSEFNIPISVAQKAYKKLGRSTREQLKVNPWILTSVDYTYFSHSDRMAQGLGFEADHPERIRSAVLAYIKTRMNAGHMAIYEKELFSADFLDWVSTVGTFEASANASLAETVIHKEVTTLKEDWVLETPTDVSGRRMVYFRNTLQVEERIISGLKQFLVDQRLPFAHLSEVPAYLSAMERGEFLSDEAKRAGAKPFAPAEEQRQAIEMALTHSFSILTGGPGTGKTTVVNAIVQGIEYLKPGASIAMLAPTGKAAKRMSEITNREAMTIHRKLNMQKEADDEQLVEIEEDYVIVDESSMVDGYLFSTLINNVSDHTTVLLVGDVDQLPSVGSGAILRDLIDSGVVPTTRLKKVFRQAESSPIVSNAYKLNRGESVSTMAFEKKSQMMFYSLDNENAIQEKIVNSVAHISTKRALSDIAVLTPMRKGMLGVYELNRRIQERVNPANNKKAELKLNGKMELYLRDGDRVMQIVNDNEKGVANGETGVVDMIYDDIVELDNGATRATTCVDVIIEDAKEGERTITYTASEARDQLELAYAMTIHKSQGSEYGTVIIPFVKQHQFMLKRNLVYTAWTRAKELVINIGQKEWIEYAAQHNDNVLRISQIKDKLQALDTKPLKAVS